MAEEDPIALVNYYARLGYGHHILFVCSKFLHTKTHDVLLHSWNVYGMIAANYPPEEIMAELQAIKEQTELRLAALVAELHLFRSDKTVSQKLHAFLDTEEKSASERSLLLAATFAWYSKQRSGLQRAKRFTSRVLKSQPDCIQAQCLYAWLLIGTADGPVNQELVEAARQKFDQVLALKRNFLDALLGKAMCFELTGDYARAIEQFDQVISGHPWFYPALCEKARMAMLIQDWELIYDSSQEALEKDPENIDALRLQIQVLLCKEYNVVACVSMLGDLVRVIERKEPANPKLYLEFAEPIARLAGRGAPSILNRTQSLIEKSHKLAPESGVCLLEMANQFFLLGDYPAAISSFRLASQMQDVPSEAAYGIVQCLLIVGSLDEAERQLQDLQEPYEHSAYLAYLKAQHSWLKQQFSSCREFLDQTVDLQLKTLGSKRDYRYFIDLNPDRLLGAAYLYLTLLTYEHKLSQSGLTRSVTALQIVLSAAPGYMDGHLMLARTLFELGELDAAQESIRAALLLDSNCASAYMLLAEIDLEEADMTSARQHIQQAVTEDPGFRESLRYYILQAKLLLQDGELERALFVLESARCLPCIQPDFSLKLNYYTTRGQIVLETTNAQRVTLYFLLVKIKTDLGTFAEATRTLDEAKWLFQGSQEEIILQVAGANLLAAEGDIEAGLMLLHQVPGSSIYFIEARISMAEIYLKFKKDKICYFNCYSELSELFPCTKTYLLLGDAHMKINDPLRAVKPYEAALKTNPRNTSIIRKIGKALVVSHDYNRAIAQYEGALARVLSTSRQPYVQFDLAELCFKLKNYAEAEAIAKDTVARIEQLHSCLDELLLKCLLLVLKAQSFQGRYSPTSEAVTKLKGFLRCTIAANRDVHLPDFCFQFAKVCEQQKDLDTAIFLLKETLKSCPVHVAALTSLTKIHLARGEISECELNCSALLKVEPSSFEGGQLLILVLLQRELYDAAMASFQQFLQRQPNCYTVLAQFIELLRRLGRIDESKFYIEQAANQSSNCMDAGLYYCKGFQARYSSDPCEAVKFFNLARADSHWGKPSLHAIVEMYSHIDDELFSDEDTFDASTSFLFNGDDISMAQLLLKESNDPSSDKEASTIAWECFGQMASRQRPDVEAALSKLTESAAKEKEHIFLMLCIAVALLIFKQTDKAKAQLRTIDRLSYKWKEGDNFERAWLMLAQIYIQAGKLDVAEQLCKKCLHYNKSSSKAWEFLGLIMERGHAYIEAASFYETAWKHLRGSSLTVGYKLARVYLKSKRYIDSISVCHMVLQHYPNFIKIRREVLEKAQKSLREK